MHLKTTLHGAIGTITINQLPAHLAAEPLRIGQRAEAHRVMRDERLFLPGLSGLPRDGVDFGHTIQHPVASFDSALRMAIGVVIGGRFRQRPQKRSFGIGQLVERLVEIGLRCGSHTIGAVTEIDTIEVYLENLVLAERLLNPQGEQGLFLLAFKRARVAVEQHVARHLLGDGRRPQSALAAMGQIGQLGTDDGERIEPRMGIEILIFRGDECVFHPLGNGVDRYIDPSLGGKLRHDAIV